MNTFLDFTLNHPLLIAGTVVMLLAVVVFELRLRARAGIEITIPEAVRMINKGATVVDVRSSEEFAAGHIVDAIGMKPEELRNPAEGRLKKKRGVLVVCENGNESQRCAQNLQNAGFTGAFSLKGGISGWRRENQPLVDAKGRAR